jgi:DNA repair exonuclease SbcCD ATPase subunit
MKHIENALETQIKSVQSQLRKEEIVRAQQEVALKSDLTKLTEQLHTDYELFKFQQNQLTEKITQMIKLEVDTRLKCDRENRELSEADIKRVIEELAFFREETEKNYSKLTRDLKEANTENSERANFLSRYIDEQVKKLDDQLNEQLKKLKVLCAKLTEQVKEHFKSEEESMQQLKDQLTKSTEEINKTVTELKTYCESTLNDIEVDIVMKSITNTIESDTFFAAINKLTEESTRRIKGLEVTVENESKALKEEEVRCKEENRVLVERIEEEIERKTQAILERVKSEDIDQWNQSIKLVEQTMQSTKKLLQELPPQVMKMEDVKKVLGGMNEAPKPKLITGLSQDKPDINNKEELENKEEPVIEKKE